MIALDEALSKAIKNKELCPRCGMTFNGFREAVLYDNRLWHKYCYELEAEAEHGK
jgi:hypothetical protein